MFRWLPGKATKKFHVVVPLHNELRVGTLYPILAKVSKVTKVPRSELIESDNLPFFKEM